MEDKTYKFMNGGLWQLVENYRLNPEDQYSWVNQSGAWHTVLDNDFEEYEIIKAKDYDDAGLKCDLHSKLMKLRIKDTTECGWIDPTGKFYGCSYGGHDMYIRRVFHKSVREVEKEGWVKVNHEWAYHALSLEDFKKQPNARQKRTLEILGFDKESKRYTIPEFEDVKNKIKINQFDFLENEK